MSSRIIKKRARFFLAVEGESERSFVKWIQELSDEEELFIHLDCEILDGGGYEAMLKLALRLRQKKERYKCKDSILLIDEDRAIYRDDNWSISKLREEAAKKKLTVCIQQPNHEGLLLRLHSGKEQECLVQAKNSRDTFTHFNEALLPNSTKKPTFSK